MTRAYAFIDWARRPISFTEVDLYIWVDGELDAADWGASVSRIRWVFGDPCSDVGRGMRWALGRRAIGRRLARVLRDLAGLLCLPTGTGKEGRLGKGGHPRKHGPEANPSTPGRYKRKHEKECHETAKTGRRLTSWPNLSGNPIICGRENVCVNGGFDVSRSARPGAAEPVWLEPDRDVLLLSLPVTPALYKFTQVPLPPPPLLNPSFPRSMSYHLRPVADNAASPSSTASMTPPSDRSPPFAKPHPPSGSQPSTALPTPSSAVPPPSASNPRPRRPLSPSSLRDVDLSQTPDIQHRKYPAPPTGHDLMAMFPPAPPDNFSELRPGPTSGYFQRQERAFFAQSGKEVVRFRVEVDLPQSNGNGDMMDSKPRNREFASPRSWPPMSPGHPQATPQAPQPTQPPPPPQAPLHHSPLQPASPLHYPHPNARPPQRGGPVPVTPAQLFPINTHSPPAQIPPNLHAPPHQPGMEVHTPSQDRPAPGSAMPKNEFAPEEYNGDPDEAWRRPMPYAERRRAGKHTKRVIVRT